MDPLLDNAPCGFLSFADDGRVLAANTTLLEMLGYSSDEVTGRHVEQLLNVGTRIFYQTHWFPLLRLHGRADEVFLMLRTHAGENLGILSYARARPGTTGVYDCVLVRVQERAKYEDELLRAKRAAEESNVLLQKQQRELEQANQLLEAQALELEQQQEQLRDQTDLLEQRAKEAEEFRAIADDANRAKSTFLATMSHELRTPLNAIGGYLEILEMQIPGPLTAAQRDIVQRIEQSSLHLLRLINEVLNLARIEAGRIDYDIQAVAVAEIVHGILPMIEPQFANKTIAFSAQLQPGLAVRADVQKAQQVLLNLLSNAMKFTPAGGRVTLRTGRMEHNPAEVFLEVTDTGAGIAPNQLEAIFQPFVQVDSSRTRTAEGTGLGLAISRDLARGMGGDLSVKSTVGEGSTFTLSLPAVSGVVL